VPSRPDLVLVQNPVPSLHRPSVYKVCPALPGMKIALLVKKDPITAGDLFSSPPGMLLRLEVDRPPPTVSRIHSSYGAGVTFGKTEVLRAQNQLETFYGNGALPSKSACDCPPSRRPETVNGSRAKLV
jgi:hypothetical protein